MTSSSTVTFVSVSNLDPRVVEPQVPDGSDLNAFNNLPEDLKPYGREEYDFSLPENYATRQELNREYREAASEVYRIYKEAQESGELIEFPNPPIPAPCSKYQDLFFPGLEDIDPVDYLTAEMYDIEAEGTLEEFLAADKNHTKEQYESMKTMTIRQCIEADLFPWVESFAVYCKQLLSSENYIRYRQDDYAAWVRSAMGKRLCRQDCQFRMECLTASIKSGPPDNSMSSSGDVPQEVSLVDGGKNEPMGYQEYGTFGGFSARERLKIRSRFHSIRRQNLHGNRATIQEESEPELV